MRANPNDAFVLSLLRVENPGVLMEALRREDRPGYTRALTMARVNLQGRPIAISGASSGIGRATALACAAAGMPVALCARRLDRLEELVDDIRQTGGRAIAVRADVVDAQACEEFVRRTVEAFGSLYAVYANAGYSIEAPLLSMSDKDLRAIFETNLFGTLNLVRPATAHMLGRAAGDGPRGHVVICSSCLALMSLPFYGAYSATKAAQHRLGQSLRLELEPSGIHVSTVHPITTRTELFDKVKQRSERESLSHESPGWMTQSAEYVAEKTVACLARPRREVWTGFRGVFVRMGMGIRTMFPGAGDFVLRRMVRRAEKARGGPAR